MRRPAETIDQSWSYRTHRGGDPGPPVPGLLMLFSGQDAWLRAIPIGGKAIVLGRDDVGGLPLDDGRLSRRHAEVGFEAGRWTIRDLQSRNGTVVDAVPLASGQSVTSASARVLRVGDSLFGLVADLRPFQGLVVEQHAGVVVGPTLRHAWDQIAEAARTGETLHITGATGAGKELAARHFHHSGPVANAPFIAVNCAAIPPNLAERLLFGARKGAYSGADADADGYVQSAHGGTLFLDEIGELDVAVQAKLLRVLENREVLALGAAKPRKIEVRFCSATHHDLRVKAAAGTFRQDLFFRIGRPVVALPSLIERWEDIPWIIQSCLAKLGTHHAHVSLVEACLLQPWPGNVRELLVEVRQAHAAAMRVNAARVEREHLSEDAGMAFDDASEEPPSDPAAETLPDPERSVEDITAILRKENGNVTRAARTLGWHRNQLRRWLSRHALDPKQFMPPDDGTPPTTT